MTNKSQPTFVLPDDPIIHSLKLSLKIHLQEPRWKVLAAIYFPRYK